MIWTFILGFFFLVFLGLTVFGPKVDFEGDRLSLRPLGVVGLFVVLLGLFFTSLTQVQAKSVGIVTTGGHVSSETLAPGYHFVAPWQKVTEIDATIQTDEYHGQKGVKVRLADGNTAIISATNRWSVNPKNAADVYSNFRSDDPTKSLRDAVVSTQFKAALNAVFAGFDPLTLAGATEAKPDYNALADETEKILLEHTKGLVDIESVTISLITLDKDSQRKIDEYISEVAKTRIAEQAQKTAAEQAKANRILSESISRDPNVLVSKCMDAIADGDFNPPAGFSCWPGGNGAVVVPSR